MAIAIKSAIFSVLLLSVAAAPAANLEGAKSTPNARDPDEKVCEDITLVGSRLAVKRVCATRAQWAEKRRRDRDMVDQAQKSPCVVASVNAGKPVC
ncbi:MAG: hypothetical protein ABIP91_03445 [Sphingomicrobium sp.]